MEIHRISLLEPTACEELVKKVEQMRSYYNSGVKGLFYTLGNALYQSNDNRSYYQNAKFYNELLFGQFWQLYELLLKHIGNLLNTDVGYAQDLSLPGFHIFEFQNMIEYSGGGRHFDLSHQKLFGPSLSQINYSFTLPIEIPTGGCGLDIWQLHHSELAGFQKVEDLNSIADQRLSYSVPYRIGEMVIFQGDYLHQIGKVCPQVPKDKRITLQGHCVFHKGYWRIYF